MKVSNRVNNTILRRLRTYYYREGKIKNTNATKKELIQVFIYENSPELKTNKWAFVFDSYKNKTHPAFTDKLPRKRKRTTSPTKQIVKNDYIVYLQSKQWQLKRQELFKARGRVCEKCQKDLTRQRADVHHITYKNLFNEPLEDLMVLCRPCHEHEHGRKFRSTKKQKVKKSKVRAQNHP